MLKKAQAQVNLANANEQGQYANTSEIYLAGDLNHPEEKEPIN